MKRVIADIETNDLLDKLTKVHCLVIRDLDSDSVLSCADQEGFVPIRDGLAVLSAAEKVYFHNGIKFDYPALRKVYPWWDMDRSRIRDTFVIASMRWAHVKDNDYRNKSFPKKLAGRHSLKAWGFRLGILKGDFKYDDDGALEHWTQELQDQCVGDTATTKALVERIRKAGVSEESVDIEHTVAWYLAAQEVAGVPFDFEKAVTLQAKLAAKREEIAEKMRVEFGPVVKKSGPVSVPKKDNVKKGVYAGCAYQNIAYKPFNPGSRPQIEQKLRQFFGWAPTEFTDSGQAKLDEKTLSGLNSEVPAVRLLLEYLQVGQRLGMLSEGKESLMKHMRTDGPWGGQITGLHHIHGRVNQNFAITHRASHSKPNVNVPKVGKPFGSEFRELFFVPPSAPDDPDGWVQIGADLAGLEARNLGHYLAAIDGGAFAEVLLKGDVHTQNRIALGLPGDTDEVQKIARDGAKTWYYAWMFGGGDLKLGNILANLKLKDGTRLIPVPEGGWTESALKAYGKKRKLTFLKNTPALARLIENVKEKAKNPAWLRMPDGRRAYVRSDHSALNTLIQGSGAIVAKRWIANYYPLLLAEFGEPSWSGQWTPMLWVHDEIQAAVRRRHAERFCTILIEQIHRITDQFKWRIPLDGEAKVGLNWKETH